MGWSEPRVWERRNVPALLRRAGSGGYGAGDAISGLYGSLFHQGTVYPATREAVPFLAELARSAPARRDESAGPSWRVRYSEVMSGLADMFRRGRTKQSRAVRRS